MTSAHLAREHNDANVICFGERLIGPEVAKEALTAFWPLSSKAVDTPGVSQRSTRCSQEAANRRFLLADPVKTSDGGVERVGREQVSRSRALGGADLVVKDELGLRWLALRGRVGSVLASTCT